jgi:hypothetical protein
MPVIDGVGMRIIHGFNNLEIARSRVEDYVHHDSVEKNVKKHNEIKATCVSSLTCTEIYSNDSCLRVEVTLKLPQSVHTSSCQRWKYGALCGPRTVFTKWRKLSDVRYHITTVACAAVIKPFFLTSLVVLPALVFEVQMILAYINPFILIVPSRS